MEILGKVNQDLSIQLFTAIDFGSNIGNFRGERGGEADFRFQDGGCVGGYCTTK